MTPAEQPAMEGAATLAAGDVPRARGGIPAQTMVCAVHGPIDEKDVKPSRGGKFKCPRDGCGRFLGRGREVDVSAQGRGARSTRPTGDWKEAFRRHVLEIRVEMAMARLGEQARLDGERENVPDTDRLILQSARRHGAWLSENLSDLSLQDAEAGVTAFVEEVAKALNISSLLDEREGLIVEVSHLKVTVRELYGEIEALERARVTARGPTEALKNAVQANPLDDQALDDLCLAFIALVEEGSIEADSYVLHPLGCGEYVVAFAYKGSNGWSGVVVNQVDVYKSDRIRAARELWTYDPEQRQFSGRECVYVLRPEAGDIIICKCGSASAEWVWRDDALFQVP